MIRIRDMKVRRVIAGGLGIMTGARSSVKSVDPRAERAGAVAVEPDAHLRRSTRTVSGTGQTVSRVA